MIKKIKLLLNTVIHLKCLQLANQLINRLKHQRYINDTEMVSGVEVVDIVLSKTPNIHSKYLKNNNFSFLNLDNAFGYHIDWDFMRYGKLWNYNLEYFDYLHQDNITVDEKLELINDFYQFSLKNKRTLEPYPVSLRAINLIRFTLSNGLAQQLYHDYLYQELEYLDKNYEFHILGNHLLENAFALCMGGAFFSNDKWHKRAVKILQRELDEQILEDGAHFELSPMYHKIIFFRLLELIDWYSKYNQREEEFLSFCYNKASLMLDWLENIKFENEDIPLFNDAAKGIAYDTSFLIGYANQLGVKRRNIPLGESGYRSFKNDKYEIKVDFAQIGASYQPGHAHADALSFILYHDGKPLFVEQGTSTYNIGKRRDLERSTEAHNTVVVSGTNQSQVWGGFRVAKRAKTTIHIDKERHLQGAHDGYKRWRVIHTRTFNFEDREIQIEDDLSADQKGVFYLHIHPERKVEKGDNKTYVIDNSIQVKFEGGVDVSIESYDYAESYNQYQKGQRLVVNFVKEMKTSIIFA